MEGKGEERKGRGGRESRSPNFEKLPARLLASDVSSFNEWHCRHDRVRCFCFHQSITSTGVDHPCVGAVHSLQDVPSLLPVSELPFQRLNLLIRIASRTPSSSSPYDFLLLDLPFVVPNTTFFISRSFPTRQICPSIYKCYRNLN